MPKTSRETVSQIQDFELAEDRGEDLGGYTADFVTIRQDHDLVQALSGLPGGQCACPHWGYVFSGQITITYGDREEVIGAGEAFYMPPGHVPAVVAGTEFLQFSPNSELKATQAAIFRAMQQRQDA
jgi:Cupin domain